MGICVRVSNYLSVTKALMLTCVFSLSEAMQERAFKLHDFTSTQLCIFNPIFVTLT